MFDFLDFYSWIGSGKFSPLLQEYSLLAVNLLNTKVAIIYKPVIWFAQQIN